MGALVNFGTIIVGGLLGVLLKKKIKQELTDSLITVMGICLIFVAIIGIIPRMITITDGEMSSHGTLCLIISWNKYYIWDGDFIMNIKTQLAPKGLEFRHRDFIISDKYATILTVITYPKYITAGYLSDLTSVPGVKVVIKHIPLPFGTITKMIDKEIAELKQNDEAEKDKTRQ